VELAHPEDEPASPTAPGKGGGWPARRTVCVLLLLVAAALAANFWVDILRGSYNDLNSAVGVPQHDFYQYYAGGHNWDLGLDPYLNHPGDARAIHQPRHDDPTISGFIYPPTILPLMGLLARADYDVARAAWLALDVGCFALLVLVAVLVSRGRRLEVLTACVLLTVVSFAFFYHVHEGQIDMIVAALSTSAFLLYPRWKGWPSAALLAVAVAIKVSPVLLVLVMVLYFRDWRFLLKTLACGLVVFAVSLAWVDVSLYREYVVRILPAIAGSDPSPYNQTPLRFWSRYPALVKVGSALGYAALLFLAWATGRASGRLPEAERHVDRTTERHAVLLLAVLLMLLFSPLAWQMAYVWVIVPLALLLVAPPPAGRQGALVALGVAAALLSMRMWPYRVLDMTNIIGAAVAAVVVIRFYLPLETRAPAASDGASGGGGADHAAADV
jgi:hypothetical protein